MFWHVSVHPSISLSTLGAGGGTQARSSWGGTQARSSLGGGYPSQVQPGGCTQARSSWGVPHLGYHSPPIRPGWGVPLLGGDYSTLGTPPVRPGGTPARGTPPQVPPGQTWLRVPLPGGTTPLVRPGWGYHCWGVPHLGYTPPPHQTWLGGYSCWGDPTSGTPHPPSDLAGGRYPCWGYPTSAHRWSTWYAAVGMPLAFTKEDFLVFKNYFA